MQYLALICARDTTGRVRWKGQYRTTVRQNGKVTEWLLATQKGCGNRPTSADSSMAEEKLSWYFTNGAYLANTCLYSWLKDPIQRWWGLTWTCRTQREWQQESGHEHRTLHHPNIGLGQTSNSWNERKLLWKEGMVDWTELAAPETKPYHVLQAARSHCVLTLTANPLCHDRLVHFPPFKGIIYHHRRHLVTVGLTQIRSEQSWLTLKVNNPVLVWMWNAPHRIVLEHGRWWCCFETLWELQEVECSLWK